MVFDYCLAEYHICIISNGWVVQCSVFSVYSCGKGDVCFVSSFWFVLFALVLLCCVLFWSDSFLCFIFSFPISFFCGGVD